MSFPRSHCKKPGIAFIAAVLLFGFLLPLQPEAADRYCTIRFCSSATGKTIMKETVLYGEPYTFQSPPKEGFDYTHYTFMGWDLIPGKTCDASYKAGETFARVRRDLTFFDVGFMKSFEKSLVIPRLSSKYKKIVLIGDSRMVQLKRALTGSFSAKRLEPIVVSARASKGLVYFVNGMARGSKNALLQILEEENEPDGRPIAIVVNYGVNDLGGVLPDSPELASVIRRYTINMRHLAIDLRKQYNIQLFYASVAPVNHTLQQSRSEQCVLEFNKQLSQNLKDYYTWINVYNHLMKYGFAFNFKNNTDGIHYTENTYIRIAHFIISQVNKKG